MTITMRPCGCCPDYTGGKWRPTDARCECGKAHKCDHCGQMTWIESHGNAAGGCANCGHWD